MRQIVWWLAPAWAAGASTYLLFGPTIARVSSTVTLSPDGGAVRGEALPTSTSLLAAQGASALFPALVPVLLAALPLFARSPKPRRVLGVIAVLLLAVFCVLGMLSIGLFYVPSVAVLLAALVVQARSTDEMLSDAAA